MASKGYCHYCKTKNDLERVFTIIPIDDKFCVCPNCDHKILIKDAKENFNHKIRSLLRRATFTLNFKFNYQKAYQQYGYVLNFDSDNGVAICGRMESLLKQSTLRNAKFDDIKVLLEIGINTSLKKVKNFTPFYSFAIKVEKILERYMSSIKKMLTFKNYFYDDECLLLYLQRGAEVIDIYELLIKGFKIHNEEHEMFKEMSLKIIEKLTNVVKFRTNNLTKPYILLNGYSYQLNKNYKKDGFKIKSDGIKINLKLNKTKKESLTKISGYKLIKDNVFASKHLKYSAFILLYVLIFLFLIVGLVLFILSFVFMDYFIIFLPIAIAIMLLGITSIIARFILKKRFLNQFKEYLLPLND